LLVDPAAQLFVKPLDLVQLSRTAALAARLLLSDLFAARDQLLSLFLRRRLGILVFVPIGLDELDLLPDCVLTAK
jgi:hypothetical protein